MTHPAYTCNPSVDRTIAAIHKFENAFLVLLLWMLAIVVLIQVISRYVFSNSLPWTEEMARLMLVYATFTGAFLTARSKSYISIDIISRFFLGQQRMLFILRNMVLVVFYGWLAWLAVDVADKTWHQELTTLAVSNGITYAVPAFGLAVLCLRSLFQIVLAIHFPNFSVESSPLEDMI